MKVILEDLQQQLLQASVDSTESLEQFRIDWLGRKGKVTLLFDEFKLLPPEEKKALGKTINAFKQKVEAWYESEKSKLTLTESTANQLNDPTLPGYDFSSGSHHPLTLVKNAIVDIFGKIGFSVAYGPEIEDDWHNFTALNFPPEHPARDMQDTFFIEQSDNPIALRTHTSSVQVRLMESSPPPFRSLMPGRVYRNEAISARAHCFFHQVEGLVIDESVSFADLKQTLYYFVKEMFGEHLKVRFRPSFFPFTEPSAEMDISCTICNGKGCTMCKGSGWVEILGCGMVDPEVLKNCGIDSEKYTGFAFGMGIERIANLKYRIKDLRLFSENDIRFLAQFKSE